MTTPSDTRARLRIAYVYRNFSRHGSIPGIYVERAEQLSMVEDVTAICSAVTREPTSAPLHFETAEPLAHGSGRVSYALECASFALRATRLLRRLRDRFDVVHVEGFAALEADLVTVHAVRPAEIEHYFDHVEPQARLRRRLTPVLRPQTGVVLAVERRLFRPPYPLCLALTKAIAADLQRHYGVPAELIELMPYGIDLEAFSFKRDARERLRAELDLSPDALAVLFVGADFERKGLRKVIAALATASRPAALVVAGDGDTAAFRALASDHGIAHRVHFLGYVRREQLVEFYSAADLVVLPSRQDAWGHPVIEGMAAGRVVAVSESAGAHEVVRQGENGFVLRGSGSAEEIASLIDGHLSDSEVRRRIGEEARRTAELFDRDELFPRLVEAHHRAHRLRGRGRGHR